MKKIITIVLALLLILNMALCAGAVTLGIWDFEAGQIHARETGWKIVREEPPVFFRNWLGRWFLPFREG